MSLDPEIQKHLETLGVNPASLSKNEIKYLTEIYDQYKSYCTAMKDIQKRLSGLNFNKSSVSKNISCSRQTLYKNPTLMTYIDYLITVAKPLKGKMQPRATVPKEKYDSLKEENQALMINIIDTALKDEQIHQLNNAIAEKDQRIQNLSDKIQDLYRQLSEAQSKNKIVN